MNIDTGEVKRFVTDEELKKALRPTTAETRDREMKQEISRIADIL